jgi:hypothetical protein
VLAVVILIVAAGCTLDRQGAPALSGPSGLGLSLAVTATPDVLPQDGSSQAVIQAIATNGASDPVAGLPLRTEVTFDLPIASGQGCPGGTVQQSPTLCLGRASASMTTGADGRASVVYSSPESLGKEVIALVTVTPVGSGYGGAQVRSTLIRLASF